MHEASFSGNIRFSNITSRHSVGFDSDCEATEDVWGDLIHLQAVSNFLLNQGLNPAYEQIGIQCTHTLSAGTHVFCEAVGGSISLLGPAFQMTWTCVRLCFILLHIYCLWVWTVSWTKVEDGNLGPLKLWWWFSGFSRETNTSHALWGYTDSALS